MRDHPTYFITGANGFIGANLARELTARGEHVVLLIHRSDDHPFIAQLDAERIRGDVLEPATYRDRLGPSVCVVHGAALVSFERQDREAVPRVNVEGTRALLRTCLEKGAASVVHLSAAAVWGSSRSPTTILTEEAPFVCATNDAYAHSKILAEQACREAIRHGLDVRIVNPATVYGQGDIHEHAGGRVVRSIRERHGRWIPPGGTSWIDIGDVVRGILAVADGGQTGENYILASGRISYDELFQAVDLAAHRPFRGTVIPSWLHRPAMLAAAAWERGSALTGRPTPLAASQVAEAFRFKYFSADKAKREIGFVPRVSLSHSIEQTLTFAAQNPQRGLCPQPKRSETRCQRSGTARETLALHDPL